MVQNLARGAALLFSLSVLTSCGPTEMETSTSGDEAETRVDGLTFNNVDQRWEWGSRGWPHVGATNFEGPGGTVALELPASGPTTRVRAIFTKPTKAGVPMWVDARLQTNPTFPYGEMGPNYHWSSGSLPLNCTNIKCSVDATLPLLPAVKGANVFFNVYVAADPSEDVIPGNLITVSIENSGVSTDWWMQSSRDTTIGGTVYHSAMVKSAPLPSGLKALSFEGISQYYDPAGSRDNVCFYLVKNPSGNVGFENASMVWTARRQTNTVQCPTPAKAPVGTLTAGEFDHRGERFILVRGSNVAIPAAESSGGTWAFIAYRVGGTGSAAISTMSLSRVDAPWTCGRSTHKKQQYWTCSEGTLNKCEADGSPAQDECQVGCMVRPAGIDDLCIRSAPQWSCSKSAHRGNGRQYWTCKDGSLYRCDNVNGPTVVACPAGCKVRPAGVDDTCL